MSSRFPASLACQLNSSPRRSSETGEGRTKILIADDDPIVHLLYRHQLERAGYQVFEATNGHEAIEVAQRELPDVIIMDIMMPQMDGLAAVRGLRKAPSGKATPIIVVTASTLYELSRKESELAGAAVFMTKPFSPAHLLEQLRDLVSVSEQNRSLDNSSGK
jgi:CheY-like chemotaxis protein